MTTLNRTAIDQRDPQFRDFFSNLQGNILKGHGRDFTNHIFIKFDNDRTGSTFKKDSAKKWIKKFAEDKITSCNAQLKENELYKRHNVSGGTFFSFYLTADGYDYLGKNQSKAFTDESFKAGMKASKSKLNDPDKSKWDSGFRDEIHAMILIADGDSKTLSLAAKQILEEMDGFAKIQTIEYGEAIRNANGDGLEHFGYVDGISQPLFFKDEIEGNIKNNMALVFDPSANLDLVLLKDPLTDVEDAFGSYFVFRKLEQHVRSFKKAEKKLAKALDLNGDDVERAGAMLVGRFEDGTPVTVSKKPDLIGSGALNNFNYHEDGDGAKCPFHAHIRKSNPRRGADDKTHTMARRGITYGHRNITTEIDPLPEQMPEDGVGLLFMSFQKSIINQFEFIQEKWVNDSDFPKDNNGIDPIIGQDNDQSISIGKFAKIYGIVPDESELPQPFKNFVSLKGGEYFFAPSIPFLQNII